MTEKKEIEIESKWEYRKEPLPQRDVEDKFDLLGERRWELVSVYDGFAYFKRRRP